jgi:hypothetical protein
MNAISSASHVKTSWQALPTHPHAHDSGAPVDRTHLSSDVHDEDASDARASSIVNGLPSSGGASLSPGGVAGPSPPSKTSKTFTGPIKNPTDFAKALLSKLGAPDTKANVSSLVDWEGLEGGNWNNSAHCNPLNTTQGMPGATDMNSNGVKSYQNWNQGVEATVKTLKNGDYNDIVNALKTGGGLGNGSYAGLNTWSSGAYASV